MNPLPRVLTAHLRILPEIAPLLLLFVFAAAAAGSQSMRTTGNVGIVLSSYKAGNQPMRWEMRVHGFGTALPSTDHPENAGFVIAGTSVNGSNYGNNRLFWGGFGNGTVGDTLSYDSGSVACCDNATGAGGDVLIRIQRDTAGLNCSGTACYTFEVCYTRGGYCVWQSINIAKLQTTWPSFGLQIRANVDVAFLRWLPGVVTAGVTNTGGALLTSIPLSAPAAPTALLGDWEFEGNLRDSSGHGNNLAVLEGNVNYDSTPVYTPTCLAGQEQSARAGFSVTLDGGGSQALDGGSALTYQWKYLPNPFSTGTRLPIAKGPGQIGSPTVSWTGSSLQSSVGVILPVVGIYDFQLTVTDGSGQSSSCVVHDGAVATDQNGVVIFPRGLLYGAADQFLGPLIQLGRNPWPWYDTVNKLAADVNMAALGPPAGNGQTVTALTSPLGASDSVLTVASSTFNNTNTGAAVLVGSEQILLGPNLDSTHITIWQRGYRNTTSASAPAGTPVNQFFYWDWWNYHTGPGTITITGGSNLVTGADTEFKTGGQYALCNSDGTPISSSFPVVWHPAFGGQTGRGRVSVASCADDTHLTLSNAWPVGTVPDGAGLNYTVGTNFELYWDDPHGDPQSINYYDNVAAYYSLWLRSGIGSYLIAARQLADTFWTCPYMDLGYAVQLQSGFSGFDPIAKSMLGLWLRNADEPPNDMTPGLELASSFDMYYVSSSGVGNVRDAGYRLAGLAYMAALDKSKGSRDFSKYVPGLTSATYAQAAAAIIANAVSPAGPRNYWYKGQASSGAWPTIQWNYGSPNTNQSVALTYGSASVVGTNTNWSCSGILNIPIWFWHGDPNVVPPTNAGGDSVAYTVASCADSGHLTLNTPYIGAGCSACGYVTNNDDNFVGWGDWGYQMAMGSRFMHYAASALALTDPTSAAYARTLAINASNWVLSHAYRANDTHGINYGADFVNCGYPVAQNNVTCSKANTVPQSLGFSAEAFTGWGSTYLSNQDPAIKLAADTMYNQMFAKPGTCPSKSSLCNENVTVGGNYETGLDPTADGYYLVGTPPNPKWLGQWFGFGDIASWPAIRLAGGLASEAEQPASADIDLAKVSGAASVHVAVTMPNGSVSETECDSSPCRFTVDRRQGAYRLDLRYLSSSGETLATTSTQVIEKR